MLTSNLGAVGSPFAALALFFLLLLCHGGAESRRQALDRGEVDILREIDKKLNVGWDFSVEPCSGIGRWNETERNGKGEDTIISCLIKCGNCHNDSSSDTSICHVVSINITRQNITGSLPEEFGNLSSLSTLDLNRNRLYGTIPATAWASANLTTLILLGNQISGRIPKDIGKIKTLTYLNLEDNLLHKSLPRTLGNLVGLSRLLLSCNFFNGTLPDTLGNLKNLTDFRIDGNAISGKIPSFFGNWTKLKTLSMQGTSMEGFFPSTLSDLVELKELMVSDIKGDGKFPLLDNVTQIKTLVLRNCSLSGTIPPCIRNMSNLKNLDLSFNNFSGEIPSYEFLKDLDTMYLNNNNLSGPLPDWIFDKKTNRDLSFNAFTGSSYPIHNQTNLNLVSSYSSSANNSVNAYIRQNIPCPWDSQNYELFINCGGKPVKIGRNNYEEDNCDLGDSTFFISDNENWAYSSTGDYANHQDYRVTNNTALSMANSELYTTARISPSSLKYFALCLQQGNYTVNLSFSEIVLENDMVFSSVGRRLFDIWIQGQQVKENFNIAEAANGTGRSIVQSFDAVVDGTTLEIHLRWAGKGTNAIPQRSTYGPLISAISVTPNFKPRKKRNLSAIAAVGIFVASSMLLVMTFLSVWLCVRRKHSKRTEMTLAYSKTSFFNLRQIKSATGNFNSANKIGEGGFGPVYKGTLPNGTMIAVKQLSSESRQGNHEFVNEIGMISALQHPNLVMLLGCCVEGNQLLLIYEFMENNSLARALFGPEDLRLKLDWQTRRKICLGVAKGLAFLHEESMLKIVHRDIKATNILLDENLNAKISDFGLAKLHEEEKSHISTRIAGTRGYMAPEYATKGYLTDKADVYSFGIVMLEVISGKSNANYKPQESTHLLDWAYLLDKQGRLLELVDPQLGSNYPEEEARQMLNIAISCTNQSPSLRPAMSAVVEVLKSEALCARQTDVDISEAGTSFVENSSDTQEGGISRETPWMDSSADSK